MRQGPVRFLLCALACLHTLTRSPLQRNLTGGNGGRGPRRRRAGREGAELRLLPRRREGGAQRRPPAQLATARRCSVSSGAQLWPAEATASTSPGPGAGGGGRRRRGPSGSACEPCSPVRVSAGLRLCGRLAAGPQAGRAHRAAALQAHRWPRSGCGAPGPAPS